MFIALGDEMTKIIYVGNYEIIFKFELGTFVDLTKMSKKTGTRST